MNNENTDKDATADTAHELEAWSRWSALSDNVTSFISLCITEQLGLFGQTDAVKKEAMTNLSGEKFDKALDTLIEGIRCISPEHAEYLKNTSYDNQHDAVKYAVLVGIYAIKPASTPRSFDEVAKSYIDFHAKMRSMQK